jgi:hypothetical protein
MYIFFRVFRHGMLLYSTFILFRSRKQHNLQNHLWNYIGHLKMLQEEYMPVPNKEQWKSIADRYQELWNIPNCLGSIDGKHIMLCW